MLCRLKDIFSHLCQNQKSELLEFGGESDHVHLLIDLSPDIAPSKLVNTLKLFPVALSERSSLNTLINSIGNLYFGQVRTV
jgi:hypothetical protein